MKLSIITVCYNAEKTITSTIKSIINQSFGDFELLVIDGNSTDSTIKTIKKTIDKVNNTCSVRIISEPDKGIYDAMNKGVDIALGEWIWFMNSGDEFYDKDVIKKVFEMMKEEDGVVYGDTWLVDDYYEGILQGKSYSLLPYTMPFCHQSVIAKRALLIKHRFDTTYRLIADMKFFYECLLEGVVFHYVPVVLSKYDCRGVSSKNQLEAEIERYNLIKEYKIDTLDLRIRFNLSIMLIRLKKIIKKMLPTQITNWIRKRKVRVKNNES